ncbi:MAG TPA: hypothetical protein DEQ98_10065 [Acidobacteria bacterium]|jgi:hypothetical protein|nr:hypothetical protein [Acidobacteriota bacterium]HCE03574.1 hypothetical protein [Acidobacteriota bacterium]|tara:strand:- start:901 stop:1086 length:186 start_codon:yes stop_codon:yes gene_type:complete
MRSWLAGLLLITAGNRPTGEEGKARLEVLAQHGATIDAFTFAEPFPPPGTLRPPAPSGGQR